MIKFDRTGGWNYAEAGRILKSDGVKSVLEAKAKEIQERCGEGYATSSTTGSRRASARVITATVRAIRSNLKHNTLAKAVH